MSVPTKVTSTTNVMDSGSSRRPRATSRPPADSQVPRLWSKARSSAGVPIMRNSRMKPTTAAAPEASTPSQWPQRSVALPPSSSTAAPISGKPISQGASPITSFTVSPSALEQVDVVDRGRPAGTEDRHDDGEADDDLRRRDDHDEEREHLARQVAVQPGE